VWLRDVVHVVRNEDGSVNSLIGFMFDISERKKSEEQVSALQKELHDLSFKDGLTGVANRRMFDTTLETEWLSAQRTAQPLSVILFDIDCFKQFNDHYGHVSGDDCLKRVGKVLSASATRPRDFFARYGGEEFVLVLPETGDTGAQHMAERCREALLKEGIPHSKSQVCSWVTVSAGVATVIPSATDDARTFIQEVDRRLYAAKLKGRNCVVSTSV
jgi:diguanylate cyclase (GGDEF)-like protein